jgi:hypothetical protein
VYRKDAPLPKSRVSAFAQTFYSSILIFLYTRNPTVRSNLRKTNKCSPMDRAYSLCLLTRPYINYSNYHFVTL